MRSTSKKLFREFVIPMFVIMGVFISVLYTECAISSFSEIGVYCTLSFLSLGVFIRALLGVFKESAIFS